MFFVVWILNCLIFACFGVIAGFMAESHEDTAMFSNFFIMPMAFFCGTFFPVEKLPAFIRWILYFLPLTHATDALRATFLGRAPEWGSIAIMLAVFGICFYWGMFTIEKSNRK